MNDNSAYEKDFAAALARLRHWFCETALPLWAAHGYDDARGGFYEALTFDAAPSFSRPRRTRTQARQIHVFSQAALRGWNPNAEAIAVKGFDFFLNHACPNAGARGCVHRLSYDGAVLDDRRDLYDQAFLLLACASHWQAVQDDRALALADRTLAFIDSELSSPHGGWLESDQNELPRRQNPHMHLFEAFMALFAATRNGQYFDYARHIIDPCFSAFYDQANGVIHERFDETLNHNNLDRRIEPGHMFEWVWLLSRFEALSTEDYGAERSVLYRQGASIGEDLTFHGFVNNEVEVSKQPVAGAKRLWPQTEYLRACLVQAANGDATASARAAKLIDAMFGTYLKVDRAGLWIDEFDRHGAAIAQDVPASIVYHLLEAVIAAETYLSKRKCA
ncbi:AGE family epimerase/isomerase [Hyphococcus sp.]|uniref:AGE family epimerase/isomerase n=1 Tax=Hyphococcus sp. TaxID=2038636 RepID=UPI0020875ECF|nr:MAG: mannose-6-phosphate isomerase [Marinicaulis sp.]